MTVTTLTDVYGRGVTVCGRPVFGHSAVGITDRDSQDFLSAPPIAIAGETPVICSSGAVHPDLLAVLQDAWMPVGTDLRVYYSESEFAELCRKAVADGEQLAMEYPHPEHTAPAHASVKHRDVLSYLNNKINIDRLVSAPFQLARTVISREHLGAVLTEADPWVLKAATDLAHGGGFDIYIHAANTPIELPEFVDTTHEFVLEQRVDLVNNWGIQLCVLQDGTVEFIAATEQITDEAGQYLGARFGPHVTPPEHLIEECRQITSKAAAQGYRGFCGIDGGLTTEGKLAIFDLNFRVTSTSCPLLCLRALAQRRPEIDQKSAESAKWTSSAPIHELLPILRPAIDAGQLAIVAAHDARLTDTPIPRTIIQVLIFGEDPNHLHARRTSLKKLTQA